MFILMSIWTNWKIGNGIGKEFYSKLNVEDITDVDGKNARVCKDFEMKKLGEYHDLYLKSDTIGWCFKKP